MGAAIAGPAAPLLGAGPPGWVAYAVVVGGGVLVTYLAYDTATSNRAKTRTGTQTATDTEVRRCDRPWTARVHAQGSDCGGTSSSTIGAPPLVKRSAPVTQAEGLALSNATWSMLGSRQQAIRAQAKARLERYIQSRPPLGQRSFPASDPSGGKRFDLDNYGCTPNFVA